MISKESLEKLKIKYLAYCDEKEYLTIKQDLDRLEELEEENKKLVINLNVARAIAKKRGKAIDFLKNKKYLKIEFEEYSCVNGKVRWFLNLNDLSIEIYQKEMYDLLKEVFGYVQ